MLPVLRFSNLTTAVVDVAAWALIHAGTGYAAHRLPADRLSDDTWLTRIRRWERDGRLYERASIRRWKDRLPEAGDLFAGGVSKRRLPVGGRAAIADFVPETRRAEYAHWWCVAGSPVFVLWNPPLVAAFMALYGVGVNLPFIAIQRYNRARILRVQVRRSRTAPSAAVESDAPDRRIGSSIP